MLEIGDIQFGKRGNNVAIGLKPFQNNLDILERFKNNNRFFNKQVYLQERNTQLYLTVPAINLLDLGSFYNIQGIVFLSHYTDIFRTSELASEYTNDLVAWLQKEFYITDLIAFSSNPNKQTNLLRNTSIPTAKIVVPLLAELFTVKSEQ